MMMMMDMMNMMNMMNGKLQKDKGVDNENSQNFPSRVYSSRS